MMGLRKNGRFPGVRLSLVTNWVRGTIYGAVFKGQLTVAAMTPMIYVHKKEMDFEGKSHLDVAVKMLRCKCIQLAATAHHYLLGLLAYAHIRTMYMGIYLYKDGGGCV